VILNKQRPHSLISLGLFIGLLAITLPAIQACSSTGGIDAGAGTGGAILGTGGTPGTGGGVPGTGGGAPGTGGSGGAIDASPPGTPFPCGDTTCVIGETYCRVIHQQDAPEDAGFPTIYDCAPFKPGCSPLDCSCIVPNGGAVYCYACRETETGGILASCGPI
jgi:hypothetical protein